MQVTTKILGSVKYRVLGPYHRNHVAQHYDVSPVLAVLHSFLNPSNIQSHVVKANIWSLVTTRTRGAPRVMEQSKNDHQIWPMQASSYEPDWRHLPADLIYTIAASLDGRSLARLESVDRFTHSALTKRSILLWRALADQPEWKLQWIWFVKRKAIEKYLQSKRMKPVKQEHPKRYFIERHELIRGLHERRVRRQKNQLSAGRFKKRSLALRWYDEGILPIWLLILFVLFVILLFYQLQTNDGSVTWLTMTPLMIFFGLITISTCISCIIRYRVHINQVYHGSEMYDLDHIIPDDYARESNSFITFFIELCMLLGSYRDRSISRFVHPSLILISFLTCIVLLSLRVTGEIDWSWSFIFMPFFLAMTLITLLPCFSNTPRQTCLVTLGVMFSLSPLMTFIILLTVYLNNGGSTTSLRLQHVFIPLYMVDAITFLGCCFLPIRVLTRYLRTSPGPARNIRHCGWILFIGPFLYIKIVLGLRADSGEEIMSNLALFLPLLLPVLASVCLAIFIRSSRNVFRDFDYLSHAIDNQSRQVAKQYRFPSTVDEIEADERFVWDNLIYDIAMREAFKGDDFEDWELEPDAFDDSESEEKENQDSIASHSSSDNVSEVSDVESSEIHG